MRAALLLLAAAALASCGYSVGPPEPLAGARTVSVPIFENRTYRRGIETDLARQIASEVASRSRLVLVDTGADLVVQGTIVDVDESVLSEKEDQQIRESSVLVTAIVTVVDGRTGDSIVKQKKLVQRESFVPGIGETVRSARIEAMKRLAADVVDLLEAPLQTGPAGR